MKLVVEQHGDVLELRMVSAGGQLAGVGVSVYVMRGVMIDSGFHGARAAIVDAVARGSIEGVVVTHWHEDHAGNVETLARLGVPIALRADTEAILRARPEIELYRRLIWRRPPTLIAAVKRFDAHGFELVHTPGHSIDHQIVWDAATGTLFSGDLWLGTRVRILHADEDPYEIARSLRRAATLAPARMFDAHRGLVERPVEALERRAEWIDQTTAEIEQRITQGWSDSAILKRVLGGEEVAGRISFGNYARMNLIRAVEAAEGVITKERSDRGICFFLTDGKRRDPSLRSLRRLRSSGQA